MKAFDELDDSVKQCIILTNVASILTRFLFVDEEEDYSDINVWIIDDFEMLVKNKHFSSPNNLTDDVRNRVIARMAKNMNRNSVSLLKNTNYSDNHTFTFDYKIWLTSLSNTNPKKYIEKSQGET